MGQYADHWFVRLGMMTEQEVEDAIAEVEKQAKELAGMEDQNVA